MILLSLLCIVAGVLLYLLIVRPFMLPLAGRVATSRKYWPGVSHKRAP